MPADETALDEKHDTVRLGESEIFSQRRVGDSTQIDLTGAHMKNIALTSAIASMLLVAACGGGGDDGSAPAATGPTAEGLYSGSTGSGRGFTGLILDDGTYYFLYAAAGRPNLISGVVQGNGTSNAGSFSSGNTRDFSIEDQEVYTATVSASYVARQRLEGRIDYGALGSETFSGTYDTDYERVPTLIALAGTYAGQVASSDGVENATVSVTSAGAVSATGASGCRVSGSAAPRARGNAFDLSLRFGGQPCLFANQTLNGMAYYDTDKRTLYGAAPNAARDDGVLFVGNRR